MAGGRARLDRPAARAGDASRRGSTRRTRASAATTSGEVSRVYPALAEMPAELFGICVVSTRRPRVRRRRRRPRVHDHERLQAVRVRAGLRAARAGGRCATASASTARGCRSTRSPRSSPARTAARTRWSTPARSPRRACSATGTTIHDGLSRFAGRELPLDDAVYASAVGDEPPQPGHRPAAPGPRPHLRRPGRGGRRSTRVSARCG